MGRDSIEYFRNIRIKVVLHANLRIQFYDLKLKIFHSYFEMEMVLSMYHGLQTFPAKFLFYCIFI